MISDATGATAKRLVQALEAQFPDQEFEDIVHPMVETVDDLRLAVDRAKGRPAVIVYTIVRPDLREAMHELCRRAKLHYCDILRQPIDSVAKVSGLQAPGHPFTVEAVRPAWETGLELFGPDRLMWGSDWPMTLLTAGYAGTWQVMSALIGELSAHEQRLLLGDTARRTYRLTAKETTPC